MPLSWEEIQASVKGKDLQKEKQKRDIYARWMPEMLRRRDEMACPKCGAAKENWVKRGSGFNRHLLCDNCGFTAYGKDIYRNDMYFNWIYYLGRKETKRRKRARSTDSKIKTYESDNI